MSRSARTAVLGAALALQASAQAQFQQKWGWSDLEALKKQVEDGVKEHTQGWTDGIASYRESVNEYTEALKDASFTKAVQALGVCRYLPRAEEESAGDIEEVLPTDLSQVEETEADDDNACEAVADEVTAQELKGQLEKGNLGGDILDKFMKLITQRSTAALCEGENGVKSWLDKNAPLKSTDPEEYKKQLKQQLKGRLNPVMSKYTAQFCPEEPKVSEDTRLFSRGHLARIGLAGQGGLALVAVSSVVVAGVAGLTIRRMTRQLQAQDLEACAEEEPVLE